MRWLPAAAAAALAAMPASAQTFEEAVRANVGLGLQLCLSGGGDRTAWANSFRTAGFSERVERSSGNSDTTHYFAAPAGTATVELYYGEMPEHCIVSTEHLGVTGAGDVLDALVPRLFPGYVRQVTAGPADPATGRVAQCVRYEDSTDSIGRVIGVAPGGESDGCVDDGTSRFYISYRV